MNRHVTTPEGVHDLEASLLFGWWCDFERIADGGDHVTIPFGRAKRGRARLVVMESAPDSNELELVVHGAIGLELEHRGDHPGSQSVRKIEWDDERKRLVIKGGSRSTCKVNASRLDLRLRNRPADSRAR